MPVTRISDVIVPEVFMDYVIERTAQLSRIRASGIAGSVPGLAVPSGGATVNMPFWVDIGGEDEVWSSGHETTPASIAANKDVAAILTRIKSWGAEDLAGMFAGDDPMRAIGDLAAAYWARREQATLLAVLKGIFASPSMGDNVMDASAELLSHTLMVDAIALMGDASTNLTGILTHSAVQFDLAKKRLLDMKPAEPGTSAAPEFSTFLNRQVIVDDGAPRDGDVYTTYFFGTGAVAFAEGAPRVPVEIERQATKSQEVLVNRRQFIMHPRGVKWTGNPAATTPSNAELATGANWQRVFESKNIPIVALRHKIG